MFEAVKLPARVPDLDSSLADVNAYDLSHLLLLLLAAAEALIRRCYSTEEMRSSFSLIDFWSVFIYFRWDLINWLGSANFVTA